MKAFSRVTALCLISVFFASASLWAAAEPALYGSLTTYAGSGKHPKTAVSGVIIDSRAAGLKAICYNYTLTTNSKIKGQVEGVVDRISDAGVERLGSFSRMNVLDFTNTPPPPADDNPCDPLPQDPVNFNLGIAADCLPTSALLEAGDIIRVTLTFKKGAKLKGANAAVNVFGAVLPEGSFGAEKREMLRAVELANGISPMALLEH